MQGQKTFKMNNEICMSPQWEIICQSSKQTNQKLQGNKNSFTRAKEQRRNLQSIKCCRHEGQFRLIEDHGLC